MILRTIGLIVTLALGILGVQLTPGVSLHHVTLRVRHVDH